MLTDLIRVKINQALASQTGNQFRPVRVLRDVLGTANDLVGRPFCSVGVSITIVIDSYGLSTITVRSPSLMIAKES